MQKNTSYKKFISILPEIFDTDEVLSDVFFNKLRVLVQFSACSIYLLNPESLEEIYPEKKTVEIPSKLSKTLFSDEILTDDIKKIFNIKENIFVSRLKIKGTLFGIIIFEKQLFSKEEKEVLTAFSNILSYKIKDRELTELFQTQLKTLAAAVNESKISEQIKTDFLANMSHELRTPLNAIIGFSELLKNPKVGKLNLKQNDYVQNIQISSIHLLGMINDILDMAKLESNSIKLFKTSFMISQPINEVANILYPLFEKKSLNFVKKITDDIEIYADFQKICQILYNLLSNAIKFTPENGKITIETSVKDKFLNIKISDTGIGIDKKNHKKIYKKFMQLNDSSIKKESSTGLGLTITKEFVKLHGGTISLKSELNKGSEFTVKLPVT